MHLYMLTRGIKHEVDRMIRELSSQYLPFTWKKKKKMLVQVAVRPVQLWEVVFPKEHLDPLVKSLGGGGIPLHQKKYGKWVTFLRKLLGAKKLPKNLKTDKYIPFHNQATGTVIVGIKEDEMKDGFEQL